MKSAHKLEAALAIFIMLSVAAYFIITGLHEVGSTPKPQVSETSLASENVTISQEKVAASSAPTSEVTTGQSTVRHEASSVSSSGNDSGPSDTPQTSSSTITTTTTTTTIATTTTAAATTTESLTYSSTTEAPTSTSTTSSQPSSTAHPTLSDTEDLDEFVSTDKIYREATQRPRLVDLSADEVDKWHQFKSKYSKTYLSQAEEEERQLNFIGNLRFINAFNLKSRALFKLDVNHFADLTRDETNNLFIGPKHNWTQTNAAPPSMRILPDNELQSLESARGVDWRNLTSDFVVDQGPCRDSAIFAIVASIESTLNAAGGPKTKLSEQQIIDCLAYKSPYKSICTGQTPILNIMEFIQEYKFPLATAQEYTQFKQAQAAGMAPPQECALPPQSTPDSRPHVGSYVTVSRDNIDEALINSSPLVVTLDASQPTFHFYKSGIYHELGCSSDSFNYHALLVAYSPSTNEPETYPAAYTIRASLGFDWGELGHMRLLKDPQKNKCLPQNLAIYPNIAVV